MPNDPPDAQRPPYREHLRRQCKDLVAMIHLPALPGAPRAQLRPEAILQRALAEARLYRDCGVHTVAIENMHDVPYQRQVGPEVVATMAIVGRAVRDLGLYCGVQVLAGCNREAVAVAHAAELDFVRVEGFVFGHLADEGYIDACAGELLRYRREIGADEVLVLADIKKKHCSHALTADVDLRATAEAARFFLADGVVVTGGATGEPATPADLEALRELPLIKAVGSGLTPANLGTYFELADLFIVGSSLKRHGRWSEPPEPDRVARMVQAFEHLRSA